MRSLPHGIRKPELGLELEFELGLEGRGRRPLAGPAMKRVMRLRGLIDLRRGVELAMIFQKRCGKADEDVEIN